MVSSSTYRLSLLASPEVSEHPIQAIKRVREIRKFEGLDSGLKVCKGIVDDIRYDHADSALVLTTQDKPRAYAYETLLTKAGFFARVEEVIPEQAVSFTHDELRALYHAIPCGDGFSLSTPLGSAVTKLDVALYG